MELVAGRPKDKSRRLEKEVRVYDLLDELQIPFERIDHEEANTMEACGKHQTFFCICRKNAGIS